jgi:hypothetical protein
MLALAGLLAACDHPALSRRYPNVIGGSVGVYDAGDTACSATCGIPPGTYLSQPSDDELWAGIVGVWRICSGNPSIFIDAPADAIGVEFAPPTLDSYSDKVGNLFFLVSGGSGPVRGAGFEYQQMYVIDTGVLYCHPSYNSGYDFRIKYSPCPREWQLATWGNPNTSSTLASF